MEDAGRPPEEKQGFALYLEGADPTDLAAMRRMLSAGGPETALRLFPGPAGAGEMGQAMDVLQAALGPDGSAAACAAVLVAWLRARKRHVKLRIQTPDGIVEYESTNLRNAEDVIPKMTRLISRVRSR